MKKFPKKSILSAALAIGLLAPQVLPSTTFASSTEKTETPRVYWDGSLLKIGQIGRVEIVKPINLWKKNAEGQLEFVRVLKSGEAYRVYGYDANFGGQFSVGGNHFVTDIKGHVKYKTPSKDKLKLVTPKDVSLQILGINDFHGQVDITKKVGGKDAGRADYLAAYLRQHEKDNPNTLMVHAGDAVGASAPTSALLQDEPTIEILNRLGFDVATVGNHEFDEGVAEMMRLIDGGTHKATGNFAGADFPYVVANVVDEKTGNLLFPAHHIKEVDGVKVGFIGVVTTGTVDIVLPSALAGVKFTNEVEAINKATAELKAQGVETIIVLAHNPVGSAEDGSNPSGEIAEMALNIHDEVDVIFGGHNHAYANTVVDGKLIVQSYSSGTAFSDVDLVIDGKTKDVKLKKATIVITFQEGMTPDAEIAAIVEKYKEKVAPLNNRVIGNATTELTRTSSPSGESTLGNFIADSQRAWAKTDFAFMNPGGIRADLNAGEITWGELFTIQPFANNLATLTMTGKQVKSLLEQQYRADGSSKILQISGLTYTYSSSAAVGSKIVEVKDSQGNVLVDDKEYSVTANIFIATGGDGFSVFKEGKNLVTGSIDLDALIEYVQGLNAPVSAPQLGRITAQ